MATGFNFAKRPFTNERLPRLAFAVATAAVIGVSLVHALLLSRSLLREQEALDSRVATLEADLQSTEASIREAEATLAQKQTALGDERTQFLTRVYRRKSFAWTALFNELEEITPAPVRVTSISPAEDDGQITVTLNVVGKTLEDVLEMVRQLEASSFFTTVFPLDESTLDSRSGDVGIAATLQLQYVEPSERVERVEKEPATAPEAAPEDDVAPEAIPEDDVAPETFPEDDVAPEAIPDEVPPEANTPKEASE